MSKAIAQHTMFAFLKKKTPEATLEIDPLAQTRRMDLEERKAFRREMLYQSIRDTFLSMEVIGSMYKFKVMPVDERHHRFIAMIDVAKSFVTNKENRVRSFAAIEQQMRINTYKRFGILVDGTYWRVSETESQFEIHAPRASDSDSNARIAARSVNTAEAKTPQSRIATISGHDYQPISDEETQAFMAALKNGYTPPPLQVGDLEYQSDLAPLDGGIMIGGTQYGRLQ
ncbi:MAG: hypothetical protein CFE43_10340 [Burkholderiales bacterium PBB3]|nr:MAG: hypothetical protein CFE43_10340 [Burkholderiales bacterium PBB3]